MHSGRKIQHVVALLRDRKTATFEDFCAGKRIGVNLVFDPGGEPTSEDLPVECNYVDSAPARVGLRRDGSATVMNVLKVNF